MSADLSFRQSPESIAAREVVVTRVFAAPRELVFKTFTDPVHLMRWWGPRGCTTTTREMEVRPGGLWRFTMHTADGVDHANRIRYEEVVADERLVYHHDDDSDGDPGFDVTVSFAERDGTTEVVLRMLLATAEARRQIGQYALQGADSTLDRLGELLTDLPVEHVVTRTFDAPRELVFRAFSEAEHLAQWWGPKGITTRVQRLDFRPGGICHYCMRAADGHEMWGKFTYVEIVPPERIVFINGFADREGNTVRPPFSDDWPREIMNTMTLVEKDGKTTLTLRSAPHQATAAERATFLAGHGSMDEGFAGTFEKLAASLARS